MNLSPQDWQTCASMFAHVTQIESIAIQHPILFSTMATESSQLNSPEYPTHAMAGCAQIITLQHCSGLCFINVFEFH